MICQLCLTSAATSHVTERLPSGQFREAHYCTVCFAAKYLNPRPARPNFPKPTFRLNRITIVVGLWAVLNAIVVWVLRSGYITGTPQQLRQWTINTLLAVNLVPAFFVVHISLLTWLQRVMWYRKTGASYRCRSRTYRPANTALVIQDGAVPRLDDCRDLPGEVADAEDLARSVEQSQAVRRDTVGTPTSAAYSEGVEGSLPEGSHLAGLEIGVGAGTLLAGCGGYLVPLLAPANVPGRPECLASGPSLVPHPGRFDRHRRPERARCRGGVFGPLPLDRAAIF